MDLSQFHSLLFEWFRKHGRVLPWREKLFIGSKQKQFSKRTVHVRDQQLDHYFSSALHRDPYRIIVSELMLQQTQVDRVLPKFEEFIQKWPTITSLSKAKLSEVMIAWKGLGYNRRARYLHQIAILIKSKFDGKFPETERELVQLPGIGIYTARAIQTFAFGKDVGVIDVNVKRIFARIEYGTEIDKLKISQKGFVRTVDRAVPKRQGDPWNQALMDFGALVCTAKSPKCSVCVLQKICKAHRIAKEKDFHTYAELLRSNQLKPAHQMRQKSKKKFIETDRYFRGRIVDTLRNGSTHMQVLCDHIQKNHGLHDRVRFGKLIEQLIKDKLITIRGSTVSLD